MNTLNTRLNADFEEVLGRLQNDSAIKAAVLISGKPGVFVAGADITMLVRRPPLAARRTNSRRAAVAPPMPPRGRSTRKWRLHGLF